MYHKSIAFRHLASGIEVYLAADWKNLMA